MKTKNHIVETKTETELKKSPVRWDLFINANGTVRFSRREARKIIRTLNLGRGQARIVYSPATEN